MSNTNPTPSAQLAETRRAVELLAQAVGHLHVVVEDLARRQDAIDGEVRP